MTASRKLGLEHNIPESTLLVIDNIHEKLEILLDTYSLECDCHDTQGLFRQAEYTLQALYGFEQDSNRHTWIKRLHARHQRLLLPDNNYII